MVTINTVLFTDSNEKGWVEYHLISHGTDEDEIHYNAHIEEVDKEGDSLSYYHLSEAGEMLQFLATNVIINELEKEYE